MNTTFAVCYAETSGGTGDSTWRDSYIRVQTSKISAVVAYKVSHRTYGHIAAHSSLELSILGSLANNSWISVVDQTFNSNQPCIGAHAAATPDTRHTGSKQAQGPIVSLNTAKLQSSSAYALCYATENGTSNDGTWRDSGIRVTVPKLTKISFGTPSRDIYSDSTGLIAKLVPRAADTLLTYTGDLGNHKWVSIVDHTRASFDPCRSGSEVVHAKDAFHTGRLQAAADSKVLTTSSEFLDITKTYTVCYAENDGSASDVTWRDSYVHLNLQKIQSLEVSGQTITTNATTSSTSKLGIVYKGTLDFTKWISIVMSKLNSGNPCGNPSVAAADPDSAHSGSLRANTDSKQVYPVSTAIMLRDEGNSTHPITTSQYAVCYAEVSGTATDVWYDSGIRLRMARWINGVNSRIASGSAVSMTFEINDGVLLGDHIVFVKDRSTCALAPSATSTFNGVTVRRFIGVNDTTTLPAAVAGDAADLTEGYYIMCLCNRQGASGACNTVNEFTLLIGAIFKVIKQPRLGQLNSPGDIRAISGNSHLYQMKGSRTPGLTLANGDKIFFASTCGIVPAAPRANETVPLSVSDVDVPSGVAQISTPPGTDALRTEGTTSRILRACFATKESLVGNEDSATPYVALQDVLVVVPMPRLGPYAIPGHIRMVSGSTPDFQISQASPGDMLFFREAGCSLVPETATDEYSIPTPMSSYNTSLGSGVFTIPLNGQNTTTTLSLSSSESETRELKACFAPAGVKLSHAANFVELPDNLKVIPEPTGAVVSGWVEAEVSELRFNEPEDHAGIEGDMVVLKLGDCNNVHQIIMGNEGVGFWYSAWCILQENGIAKNFRLAESKVKELPAGKYKVCYATKSSEGWSQNDWTALSTQVVITATAAEPPPTLDVPESVALGTDIVIIWNASTPLMQRNSQPGAWLGLYKAGTCGDGVGEGRHECYLASRSLPVGIPAGVVRFVQAEYKVAGEYEVRYMKGDLSNSQGRSCRGLTRSPAGTYLYCMYVAAATSQQIRVFGQVEQHDDLSSVAGLEHIVLV
jgi:hypothetical protein